MAKNLFDVLVRRFTEWQARQRAYDELTALDDRSLADIGIARSDIPYILAQHPERDERPAATPAHVYHRAA